MKKLVGVVSALALSLALIPAASADSSVGLSKLYESKATGAPETIVYDAASAMAYLRTLKGTWKNTAEDQPAASGDGEDGGQIVSLIAAGSVVRSTYLPNSPFEM